MNRILRNTVWLASATLFSLSAYPSTAQTLVRPTLNAEQCQPLSAANADLCCIAMNRQQLLTSQEIDQCPPVTTARIQDVMQAQESVDTDQTNGVIPTDGAVPTDGTGQPGEEPEPTEANANSGAGNGGETGPSETGSMDSDPGNSEGNNNAPDSPPGQN